MAKKKKEPAPTVALDKLDITYMKPSDLKPNDYNPNRQSEHDFELLCKSIDEDGMTQPIVALRDGHVIVDGEHRWRACMALKFVEVPVVLTDMSLAQAKVATLRHNRARGEENVELAAALLKGLANQGDDVIEYMQDSLNLDEIELENFLDAVDDQDGFTNDEAAKLADANDDELKEMVIQEGGEVDEHQSASAQDVIRAREDRISKTKTEQERQKVIEETSVYRLRLVFTADEAKTVRAVLGKVPVQRLLEICKERASA